MTRVVVAGAGFAGIGVAKALRGKADVTLIAPTNRFVYLPLIHELVSEHETPPGVSRRLAQILPDATLVEDRVIAIEGREAATASGERFGFDHFVHAAGAEPNDFGIPGVREHTFSFYSIQDALLANGHLKAAAASVYGRPPSVIIIGASFTGIEVAGEVRELMDKLDVPCDIRLLDAAGDIFPHQSERFRSEVLAAMEAMDLHLELGTRIRLVNDGVVLCGGPERTAKTADIILWCAGVKPRAILGVDPNVRPNLQSLARDDVWVVGDAAAFADPVPRLAQMAEQQGPVAAHNILHPDTMRPYVMDFKGIILSIGRSRAVAELASGRVMSGRIPAEIKRRLYKAKIRMV